MHSCWSIFNSVLLAFGLNVFDSNSLVKMLWKIIIKKKEGKPSQPPGPNPFPPARFPFPPPHRSGPNGPGRCAPSPLSPPTGPRASVSPIPPSFFLPAVLEQETIPHRIGSADPAISLPSAQSDHYKASSIAPSTCFRI
jgi:hypothetical protein